MLYISYGITKSGSTLAFELAKELLVRHGHPQERLAGEALKANAKINFVSDLGEASLRSVSDAVAAGRVVVLKTHSGPTAAIAALLAEEGAFAHAVYRDPRELVLSLLDAGAKARQREEKLGRKVGFSDVQSTEDALRSLDGQLENFRRWVALPGVFAVAYDEVAFGPAAFLRTLEDQLGLPAGAVDYDDVAASVASGAFTQRNKGVRARYRDEMTEADQTRVLSRFSSFYAEHAHPGWDLQPPFGAR